MSNELIKEFFRATKESYDKGYYIAKVMGASFCGYDTTVSVGAILALAQKVKSDFEKAGISVNIENMKPYFKTCVRSSDTTHWGLVLLIPKDKLSHIDGSKLEKYNLDYDTSMFPGSL